MTVTKNRTEIKGAGGDIVLYRTKDGRTAVDVRLERETIWLTQKDMAALFATERSVITKHIRHILNSNELNVNSVCANFAHTAADGKTYQTTFYNLDMIISVGYRVNSRRGTEFRIWATQVLKDHILKGYTLNEQRLQAQVARLKELRNAVDLMGSIISKRSITGIEAEGLLKVITDYSLALSLLDQYDHQQLRLHGTTETSRFILTCEATRTAIGRMVKNMGSPANNLVGREKDKGLESAIGAIYQTFGGCALYPSIEDKAAHLLYFVVKNHAFVDGNKRIGAFLFIWFLDNNGLLYRKDGSKRLADNALVALMLPESDTIKDTLRDTINKAIGVTTYNICRAKNVRRKIRSGRGRNGTGVRNCSDGLQVVWVDGGGKLRLWSSLKGNERWSAKRYSWNY